ncbi:MAG TPA: FAD-dependent monooxygenase [Gemmataceae bacterium]|jgi:2-polyprenyl-6-methoxyphenol hydroxylase-like FAD-dependent oxidoreductase
MVAIPSETEILIAGAGPTGLALCAELRRRGFEPLIVDKVAEGANTSRAVVIHARTLEVLEPLGLVPRLLEEGIRVPIFRVRDHDTALVTIDFKDIPSKYAFTLMCPQDRTEAVLLARLQALGGEVVRPWEVTGLTTAGDRVRVTVMGDGSMRQVTARWVVGCDGLHSRVREAAGIAFRGAEYEQTFALADVRMDWPIPREEVTLFFSPEGFFVVAPLPGDHYRMVAAADDVPREPTMEYVQAVLDSRGPKAHPGRVRQCLWSTRFHVHHRIAASPRKGRVLLCGDAAHVHSPAGGQGMNTGIQDAVTLADVLADVLRGGDDARLDDWAADRHRIAEGVVRLTDRMMRVATLRSPPLRRLRNLAVAFAGHVPPLRRAVARRLAELNRR